MKLSTLAAAASLALLLSGSAFAQTTPAPVMKPAVKPAAMAPAATAPDAAAKAAKSAECSKEADAKGLHGKERKKFRESCKMGKM